MQQCGKCGEYNSEESTFCGRCGNKLNNKCPDCGFPNLPQQMFCGSCGKQLQSETDLPGSAVNYGKVAEEAPGGGDMVAMAKSRLAKVKLPSVGEMASGLQGQLSKMPPMDELKTRIPTNDQLKSGIKDGISKMSGLLGGHVEELPESNAAQWVPPPPSESDRAQAFEEARARLDRYAVLSIELVPPEKNQVLPEAVLAEARSHGLQYVQAHMAPWGAQFDMSKNNVVFASFPFEASLEASLERAIAASFDILWGDGRYENAPLKLRIGLDLDSAKSRNPLAATMERMVAAPGALVVSKGVYALIEQDYQAEKIGPLPMGDRTMTFYRLLAPSTVLPEEPSPEVPVPAEPVAAPVAGLPAEPLPEAQLPAEPVAEAPEELAPVPVAPEPAPVVEAMPPEPTVAPEVPADPNAPRLPEIPIPVYTARKPGREPNLTYEKALEALVTEFSGFLAQGVGNKGRIVSLSASGGLGKSHMVFLARQQVDAAGQRAAWLTGLNYRCFAPHPLPLYYWLEMMQDPLGLIFEGQVARDVRQQVAGTLGQVYGGEVPAEQMAFLSDFLSINPTRPLSIDLRDNIGLIEDFFLDFLRLLTSKKPLVLTIEDLDFIDPGSLDVLVRLIDRGLMDLPILLVMTHSREFYPAGALAAITQKVPYKELVVSDLSDGEAERFMDHGPFGGRLQDFPPHLIDMLVRHARGLPIFLEESLRYLFLQGILSVDPATGKFVLAGEYSPGLVELPDKLPDLISRRLDHLSEQEMYLLQMASVLGEKFSFGILEALAQMEKQEFEQALHGLYNHGFIVPDPVNTARFRHGIIWQTVYQGIAPDLRMEMHQLISETLENDLKQGLTVNPMLIAFHADQGELPNRALTYWNIAGVYAAQAGSLTAMNVAMDRSMKLLAQTTQEPLHRQEVALRTYESVAALNVEQNAEMAVDMLDWVIYHRRQAGATTGLIEPLNLLASACENKGDFTRALVAIDEVLAMVDAANYPREAGTLLLTRMEYLYALGKLQQAREVIENQLAPLMANPVVGQDLAFYEAYLNTYLFRSQALLAQCDADAFAVIEEGLRLARERRQPQLDIALQLVQGQGYLKRGLYEHCNREADGLLSAIERMEDPDWFLAQWGLLAIMYHCELQDWESASQLVLTVMTNSENARDYQTWVLAQIYAGYITARSGNVREGCTLLEKALELSAEYRFAACALTGWRFLAEAELLRGNRELAAQIAGKAVEIAGKPEIQNRYEQIKLQMLQAHALVELGEVKPAGKLLEPLWPLVAKTRFQPLVAECSFEIGCLYKRWAQDAPADLSRKHLMRSMEFFLKAKSIWLELHHMPHVKRVDATAPQL